MTKQQAIDLALECIRTAGISIKEVENANRMPARELPKSVSVSRNQWIVRFSMEEADADVVDSVDLVVVSVDEESGEAVLMPGL